MTDTTPDNAAIDSPGHPDTTVSVGDADDTRRWRRVLAKCGLVYLFSRLCVSVGAAIVAAELKADENLRVSDYPWARWADPQYAGKVVPHNALRPMLDVFTSWDGLWYLRVVRTGYPRSVMQHVTYEVNDARAAFFPTYPMLVRWVDKVLPGGDTIAALFVNFILGALAILLVGVLARRLFDIDVADRAMVLMAMFPGSFVLSFAYTEALLLVLAAACLWLLLERQWLWAGVVAALGTATRPNGIALVAACAVAAFLAIRERREWRSLVAVLLAPVGFVAFQLWLGWHAGERLVWFRVQSQAWSEGTSWGYTAVHRTLKAIVSPLTSPTNIITLVCVVTLIALAWMAHRHRLPPEMIAYAAVVVLLMLIPNTVTARPRFLYTAFPLFISAAAWFSRERRHWWPYMYGACAAGLVGLTALYGVKGAIP